MKANILTMRREPIEFTNEQQEALLKIEKFINSKDLFFLLVGNAGTGKTTLCENIYNYGDTYVIAPTNAAVKRLREKILDEEDDDSHFSTIHRVLYGAPDPKTGKFLKRMGLKNKQTYIIDESSMIDVKMFNDLITEAERQNAKLIFVGDDFQLEPVGQDPKLFEWEKTHNKFSSDNKYKLNEVKRNDGEILRIATHLRTSTTTSEILKPIHDDVKIVDQFTSRIPTLIKEDGDYIVIVSTNRERIEYNKHIRKLRYGKMANDPAMIDERVMSVSNNYMNNGEHYKFKNPDIIKQFTTSINIGSISYPKWNEYTMYLIKDENEITLLIPELDIPSLHGMMLMTSRELYNDETLTVYNQIFKKRSLKHNIIIATYGYAISAHKSQGSEWEHVFIDVKWLSPAWNHSRWLYTAITRARKTVELKRSHYYKIV